MSTRTRKADGRAKSERGEKAAAADFPIVGVGASAGGLEAFTRLLEALPIDTGMAFVLVQHLDPDHESQLTQILSGGTALPVREITNDERVEPNHVYVIRRDTDLTVNGGVLKVQPRKPGLHRPIDTFFESLAADRRERAIGVVLSGTATDGTLGLEAIKAEGGITFAQDDSAKHPSMPRSAVAAGCVDLVLSPAGIASELARIAKHPYVAGQEVRQSAPMVLPSGGTGTPSTFAEQDRVEAGDESSSTTSDVDGYEKILLLLHTHSGVDFSLYKSSTIRRRVSRRVVLTRQDTLSAYARFLSGNTTELDALYSDVLIGVTSFFRNPETFEVLREKVFPRLLEQGGQHPLRCWILGCSTGQEAYSIAMAFTEAVEKAPHARTLQIFATDLNEALLDKARQGLYARSLAEEISPERLRRFFVQEEGGYRVSKSLREMVIFARQNLIGDPPFSRMDLISCRNLLIYLEPSLQKKALPTFHYALKPSGFLLLGASESIGGFADLFEPVDKKHKIYSKKSVPVTSVHLPVREGHGADLSATRSPLLPAKRRAPEPTGLRSETDPTREADRLMVNQFAPPGVIVNTALQVLQFRGETGAFLELAAGKASFDVLKMAREGLMLPLRSALNQAKADDTNVRKDGVRIKRNGSIHAVNVEVIPLKNLPERCFLVLFEEADKASAGQGRATPTPSEQPVRPAADTAAVARIAELEAELAEMREYLSSLRRQHEFSNEEVQAANQEVQSANDELQSINEELETSKEELQSANEELTTVNEEMSNRNVELNRLNNDLINLQASTKLAVVLFGRDRTIRRFSPQAEKQFDLLLADVGRPVSHLRHNLVEVRRRPSINHDDPAEVLLRETALDLDELVAGVIKDVREQEREVRDRYGRWHSLRVRPYMTSDAVVDGAVLVLVDVDELKRSEQANGSLAAIVESSTDAITSTTLGGVITSWNAGAEKLFGFDVLEAIGRHISIIVPAGLRGEEVAALARLRRGEKIPAFETEQQNKDGRAISVSLTMSPIKDGAGLIVGTSRTSRDISERRSAERALREVEERYRVLVEQVTDYAIFRTDTLGRATTWNEGVKRVLGFERDEFVGVDISATIFMQEDLRAGVPQRELEEAAMAGSAGNDRWMRRKDGQRFFANGTTTALRENSREISGFAKVMRDQTGKRQAEEALRSREEQLKSYSLELSEAASRKNEFLAMLGHELRNPLAAISHGLDLQGRVLDDPPRAEDLRSMMVRQTTRIVALLDQLLDIARVISGKVELSKETVDLADVVRTAVETVKPLLDAHERELVLSVPEHSPLVVGDLVRLTQIVENLLSNAVKYTNGGGRIELTVEAIQDTARITVRDDGIGMNAELLPHIFEVFTQAPRALDRAKGGLGLGLPLAQRLVEMHGGHVFAESPGLGRGSTFVVTLPCTYQARPARADELRGELALFGPVSSRRVLIVDDEADTAETLAELLEEDGHHALAVHEGREALDVLESFHPDVVLLDIGLPGMDGYDVATRLRQRDPERKIFVVAVTGYQTDPARLKEAGFDEHLLKPPDLRRLRKLLAAPEGMRRRD